MTEVIYRFQSLDKCLDKALETMDFTESDRKSRKIDFTIMELSRQLRSGIIDCLWYENSYEKVVLTRSLKDKGVIQITSISQKDGLPNGDEQASDYKELLEIARRNSLYKGIKVHALTV